MSSVGKTTVLNSTGQTPGIDHLISPNNNIVLSTTANVTPSHSSETNAVPAVAVTNAVKNTCVNVLSDATSILSNTGNDNAKPSCSNVCPITFLHLQKKTSSQL